MYIEQDVKRANDFIKRVFDFYNGRINHFNYPAILNINWANQYSSSTAGFTRNPNIVVINPAVIGFNADNQFQFYYTIIETVIHELFHTDQIIDYIRITVDNNYKNYIECAVETQTHIYIVNHVQEILENFGIQIIPENYFNERIRYWDNGYSYYRKHYEDHIISNISLLLNDVSKQSLILYDKIRNNIQTLYGEIIITINGDSIIIQKDKYLIPIENINKFFYDKCFKYDCFGIINSNFKYETINNRTIININADINVKNKMIKVINP